MTHKAPGKSDREGMTILELMQRFPTEDAAREWFEQHIWPDGRYCPHCGSTETFENPASESRPYRCKACGQHFSVRIGTVMERSKISLQKWAMAIYLHLTSLKGVSSMKLHRDIGVTQKTAWFMLQRIRKAWESDDKLFAGPVEIDETYMGGRERNKYKSKKLKAGRGTVGKTAVIGAKDRETKKVRAKVVKATDAKTLQKFVIETAATGATVYTDDAAAYKGMPFDHHAVKHSVGEYVRGMAHTNGIESFWSMLKRAHKGVYHKISAKHLQRYVDEFSGRHDIRKLDTTDQMGVVAARMAGKRLSYRGLIA